ncbi:MAG: HD domain-containing protein [Pseudomonadota bacterium]|nr:HD domain-containing protein [Pseudomonadota bacterium]
MELPIKTETIGLTEPDLTRIFSLYSSRLAYHNFEHVIDVLLAAKKILQDCANANIPVNRKVVNLAILFHDAGYEEDHDKLGFSTKEAYSAYLAKDFLKEKKFSTALISQIQSAILATEKNGKFPDPESKAVRAADLYGLSLNYNIFLENAKKIKTEFELLKGHSIGWQEWKLTTIKLLKEFVSREIELTPFFSSNGGPSEFYLKVTANLEKFLSQPDR